METETQNSKEARKQEIEAELEAMRKQAAGNPEESKQLFERMNTLQKELFEIDPPTLTPK